MDLPDYRGMWERKSQNSKELKEQQNISEGERKRCGKSAQDCLYVKKSRVLQYLLWLLLVQVGLLVSRREKCAGAGFFS